MNWHDLPEELKKYHIRPFLDEPSLAMLRETCASEWRSSSPPEKAAVSSRCVEHGYVSIVSLLLSRFNTRYLNSLYFGPAVWFAHKEIVEHLWHILVRAGWKGEDFESVTYFVQSPESLD